ncbi:hypothetical protein BOX37_20420 [Nocardia mangyaensis]|uniref:Uncharacterized protein n=1 Tax=Nocardia mangyaensis TaxID=2213200 RepID=A0A1J0VV30_9NOCA|nr:hypothetical protein [Nocardia mangyaensis]APE35915.1 hypothetical protein BOX37_20420 [Nocardia mangyaensis]
MTTVRDAADVRRIWARHCGDKPVPTRDRSAERLRRALADADRERVRRDQLEAARQRLEGVDRAPWPDAERAWLDALRIARSVFTTP